VDEIGDLVVSQSIDDFIQEAAHEKLFFRDGGGDTAGAKVKHFVFADLAGGGAVVAFHVIGQNTPRQACGDAVKVGAVLPGHATFPRFFWEET